MRGCMRCGRMVEDFDVGGDGICFNCEAAASSHGTGTDVPCQRCGMYLPPHELRMWNSRLYCAYCIMDIQDEERMMHAERRVPERQPEPLPEASGKKAGACERCGRQVDSLYTLGGKRLCAACYSDSSGGAPEGAPPTKPAIVISLLRVAKSALGIREPAKPVESGPSELVFDVRSRKMVEKRIGIEAKEPLHDPRAVSLERKASQKSKKTFFGLLGSKKDS